MCWGGNEFGALGNGSTQDSTTPVSVTGLSSNVLSATTGLHDTCAVMTTGTAKCWGSNDHGQLGNGTTTSSTTPVDVTGITNAVQIDAGDFHTCAVLATGAVECWGSNVFFQLGNGTTTGPETCSASYRCSTLPVGVTGLSSGAVAVSSGFFHSCALTTAGGTKCWGSGPLNGYGTNASTPIDVGLNSGAAMMGGGGAHTCAVRSAGGVKCWGLNYDGQTGNGSYSESTPPTSVVGKMAPPETDGDGCPDEDEQQTAPGSQTSGGLRDPLNPNDYFNPSHDGMNRIDDVLLVVDAYFIDAGNPAYNADTDRTLVGPNAWNLGPPSGLQRIDDVVNMVKQYFHDCS